MRGHIYRRRRPDGSWSRWYAVLDLPKGADGSRRQRTTTHDTKRNAQAWLAQVSQEMRARGAAASAVPGLQVVRATRGLAPLRLPQSATSAWVTQNASGASSSICRRKSRWLRQSCSVTRCRPTEPTAGNWGWRSRWSATASLYGARGGRRGAPGDGPSGTGCAVG